MVKGISQKLRLFWHVIYSATLGRETPFYNSSFACSTAMFYKVKE